MNARLQTSGQRRLNSVHADPKTHKRTKRTLFNQTKQDWERISEEILSFMRHTPYVTLFILVRQSRALFLPQEFNWQKISELSVCFCIVRTFEKEDFLRNLRLVLFCLKLTLETYLCRSYTILAKLVKKN